jgi:hypothetical protein
MANGNSKQMTHILVLLSVHRLSNQESLFKFEINQIVSFSPLFENVIKIILLICL